MGKGKGTGNWKPLGSIDPLPVPARGTTRMPGGNMEADIVLPIDPNTLLIVEEEPDDE